MHLQHFVSQHPGCRVVRPAVMGPALFVALPIVGCALSAWLASRSVATSAWWMALLWLCLGGLLAAPLRGAMGRLRAVLTLLKQGRASIAIAEDDVLLIDGGGNAVVVALDRVTSLELDGHEARLRTDSDMQGVIYAILFRLFDEDAPGPSADRFFQLLAPRLRERCPEALIVRHS